ncbi:TetR/AcrR family transcriptional regulator [bacterium]|nr:TetR/AcrR family transcriptional regulator [bacterium]
MPSGRVREFDADEALDRAMGVFWRHGYEGTSLADLTAAMGINRPSLYSAFGNKEQLFRKVLDRYQAGPLGFAAAALEMPTARGVVEAFLDGFIRCIRGGPAPGCLVVSAALVSGEDAEPVRRELARLRRGTVAALRGRFERAASEGDLAAGTDCGALALYVAAVLDGLAVLAASGATEVDLGRVAELTMRLWPS